MDKSNETSNLMHGIFHHHSDGLVIATFISLIDIFQVFVLLMFCNPQGTKEFHSYNPNL